jgi:hypothetical protein
MVSRPQGEKDTGEVTYYRDEVSYFCALCYDTHIEIRRTPGPSDGTSSKKIRQARA